MKLSTYMKNRKLGAADLAREIGVSPQAVRRYCSGERIPAPEVMRRIVAATGGAVQPNDFYDVPPAAGDVAAAKVEAG